MKHWLLDPRLLAWLCCAVVLLLMLSGVPL